MSRGSSSSSSFLRVHLRRQHCPMRSPGGESPIGRSQIWICGPLGIRSEIKAASHRRNSTQSDQATSIEYIHLLELFYLDSFQLAATMKQFIAIVLLGAVAHVNGQSWNYNGKKRPRLKTHGKLTFLNQTSD